MEQFFDLLASEIYYAYFLAIGKKTMLKIAADISTNKKIYYTKQFSTDTVLIKTKEKIHVNSAFIVEITNRIAFFLERDAALFKNQTEIETHFYYAILFTFSMILDEYFLEDFTRAYNKYE